MIKSLELAFLDMLDREEEKARQKGWQAGKIEVEKNMIKEGFSSKLINKTTGIKEKEIEIIKKELNK